jgi:hypothetical protein
MDSLFLSFGLPQHAQSHDLSRLPLGVQFNTFGVSETLGIHVHQRRESEVVMGRHAYWLPRQSLPAVVAK